MQIGKEEVKLPLFADDMIYAWERPKFQQKTSRNDKFSNIAGYRIKLHESITFLYTNSKHTEKGIMDTIPFTIGSNKINYLGINLTKEMKDLYNENINPKIKRQRKTLENGKIPHAHGLVNQCCGNDHFTKIYSLQTQSKPPFCSPKKCRKLS